MRSPCVLVASAAILAGCQGESGDPALGPCADRAPAIAVVGTGKDRFEPIGQTVPVQIGPPGQGIAGFHIWYGLRCQNLGPHILAEIGVDDVETGALLTPLGLREAIDLAYDEVERADEVYGIRAFLVTPAADAGGIDPSMLTGRKVRLWVKAEDTCQSGIEADVTATVDSYLPP